LAIDPNNLSSATLTFNDDFNTFDTARWGTAYPWGGTTGNTNEGNNEEQWYLNADYAARQGVNTYDAHDGMLDINAAPTPASMMGDTQDHPYTSGLINTQGTFSQTYGYFEMRASLPAGQGVWPAFWLLNEEGGWPPELDVIETIGSDPDTANMTVHTAVGGHSMDATEATIPGLTGDGQFHTYGVDWQADDITWYIDGNEVFQSETPSDMHDPMYMLANLAIGGDWPGSPDGSTEFPSTMSIDYIRAYSDDPSAQAVAPGDTATAPNAGNGGAGSGSAAPAPGGSLTPPATGSDASAGNDGRGPQGQNGGQNGGQAGADEAQAGAAPSTDGETAPTDGRPGGQDGDTASAGPDAGTDDAAGDPDTTGSIGGQDGTPGEGADDVSGETGANAGAGQGWQGHSDGGWGRGGWHGWQGRDGWHGRHEGRGSNGDDAAADHHGDGHGQAHWHADGRGSSNGNGRGTDASAAVDPETTGTIGTEAPQDGTSAPVTSPSHAGTGSPVDAGAAIETPALPAEPTSGIPDVAAGMPGTDAGTAAPTGGSDLGGGFDFSQLLNPSQGGSHDAGPGGFGGTWSHLLQDAVGAANGQGGAFAHGGWQNLLQDVLSRCGGSAGQHGATETADAGATLDMDAHLDLSALHGAQEHAAQMLHA